MKKVLTLGTIAFVIGLALGVGRIVTNNPVSVSAPVPQSTPTPTPVIDQNQQLFQTQIAKAKTNNLSQLPMSQIMQAIAQKFLGAKYEANLLDQLKQETLVITLDRFDCLIFVETVLALARQISLKDYSYQTFANNIVNERYINGEINGYCSRLHYFTAWLEDNQKRGNINNITASLGGIPLNKKLNFMGTHRDKYPQLAQESNYQCILAMEKQVNQLKKYYIPTGKIKKIYSQLKPGDIIAIATAIPGLDVTHTGLVYANKNGSLGIIHASPGGEVTIAPDLQRYASKIDQSIGIMVARPIDPRSALK